MFLSLALDARCDVTYFYCLSSSLCWCGLCDLD